MEDAALLYRPVGVGSWEQLSPVERHHARQRGGLLRAILHTYALLQCGLKLMHVRLDGGFIEANIVAVRHQNAAGSDPRWLQLTAHGGQRLLEAISSGGRLDLRPEDFHQIFARVVALRVVRQIGQQFRRLLGLETRNFVLSMVDLKCSHETYRPWMRQHVKILAFLPVSLATREISSAATYPLHHGSIPRPLPTFQGRNAVD